ncbi:hypothetical protein EW145_g1451 [Phellinidium pouzarii]|uniref:Transmembrane protein n=1 Tax=Phellinidium pouzarii TaxID=167371 RepID=A0A4V3XDL7_9AGAM|nr:hypothetical protein EW145_g1451 [Phellinidium pouzarii]
MSGRRHSLCVFCTTVLIYALCVLPCAYSSAPHRSSAFPDGHKRLDSSSPFLTAPPDVPMIPTTSSFDFWWPYPPASLTAADAVLSSSASPEETGTSVSAASDTTSSDTSESMSSDFEFVASTIYSQSGSAPAITITALPPLASPFRGSRAPISTYRKSFNYLLLIPILGIASGAVGLACGWWGYDIWRKRWPRDSGNDFAGPRYEYIQGNASMYEEKDENNLAHEAVGDDSNGDSNSGGPQSDSISSSHRHDCVEVLDQPSESKWPRIALSALLHSSLLAGITYGRVESASEPVYEEGSQQTQFLTTDPYRKTGRREGLPVEDLRSPFAPTVFSSVATSDEDDEDYDNARQTVNQQLTARNKSIRRRIVERLQLQFSPRRGFIREKPRRQSKLRGRTPELEKGVVSVSDTSFAPVGSTKRNETVPSTSRHGRAISDFTIAIDELQTPVKVYAPEDKRCDSGSTSCKALRNARTYSFPLNDSTSIRDKYTPLPKRKSKLTRKPTSMQGSKQRMEMLEDFGASFSPSLSTVRHILPASPPLVSSPWLEAELFFSSGAVSIASSRRSQAEILDSCNILPVRKGSSGPRRTNKLLSKHSPARTTETRAFLPTHSAQGWFKPLPPSPPRRNIGRSSSSTPAKWTLQSDVKGRPRSNTAPPVPLSLKDRYEAHCVALNKVDTIVSHGWSTRNIRGIPAPSSPTMFGANVENAEILSSLPGIEQTLGRF